MTSVNRREEYLTTRIETRLGARQRALRVRGQAQDAVTTIIRDVACPRERSLLLREMMASCAEVLCHDGEGAETGVLLSQMSSKAFVAGERIVDKRRRP